MNEHERERPVSPAEEAYHGDPTFDEDEGLDDQDEVVAESFPASDPPPNP